MADSTLAAMDAHTPIVDADSSYIENGGVKKKVAASVWKTYVSDTPTLVTPVLGTPSAGDISACTSTSMALTTPDLGVPSAITLTNADGTVTDLTLVTPILGTPQSGDISACTSTSLTMVTPVLGIVTSGDISACTSTDQVLTTPQIDDGDAGLEITSVDQTHATPVATIPDITGAADSFVMDDTAATLTAKTLADPIITGLTTDSITAGITANAGGGGVGSAVALTTNINEISTCATGGDSVHLPTAVAGQVVRIINNGVAACDVYPFTGDDCGATTDTAVSLGIGANITYICYTTALWVAAS